MLEIVKDIQVMIDPWMIIPSYCTVKRNRSLGTTMQKKNQNKVFFQKRLKYLEKTYISSKKVLEKAKPTKHKDGIALILLLEI